jgi:hypothetical protein
MRAYTFTTLLDIDQHVVGRKFSGSATADTLQTKSQSIRVHRWSYVESRSQRNSLKCCCQAKQKITAVAAQKCYECTQFLVFQHVRSFFLS